MNNAINSFCSGLGSSGEIFLEDYFKTVTDPFPQGAETGVKILVSLSVDKG
jgi:hypothetical protein